MQKNPLCCAHFWSIVLTAVPYGYPCGWVGSPRTRLSYSDMSLHEALRACGFPAERAPKQKVKWAERKSENGEFWKFSSKAPWTIPFREFVTVKMADSAQPSYAGPILIRAPYFCFINKCWPMNSNWTFMISVFYRMHNDSMKMLHINLFHLLSYFMLEYWGLPFLEGLTNFWGPSHHPHC